MSRAAALTMAYANRGLRVGMDDVGSSSTRSVGIDRTQLEQEAKELSPDEAKKWVQASLNEQVGAGALELLCAALGVTW